jgi:hypothetical protein
MTRQNSLGVLLACFETALTLLASVGSRGAKHMYTPIDIKPTGSLVIKNTLLAIVSSLGHSVPDCSGLRISHSGGLGA